MATTPAPGAKQCWPAALVCLGLAMLTLGVFGQTFNDSFINCDDPTYVYENPMVSGGLTSKGIAWAFTTFHAENWHPLTWLSHMLDCQLYGPKPGGHHLTSVLIHTATVIVLFLVLRQLTGAFWRCALVAAVFAIHPLRVESVAWVAERKDVLSGLFFVLTIGAYAHYARRPWSIWRYGLVMLLLALGLMCKPMLVTLPLVLLLLDCWPLRRQKPAGQLVLEKLPLLALSAASCWVTVLAQKGAIQSTEAASMPLRFENGIVAIAVYLRQMVWPADLALNYPFPQKGIPAGEVAVAAIVLIGLSAGAWMQRRSRPWLLTGWLWYLVMLVPVLGIVQVGAQAHADRYTYLPQIGFCFALAWLGAQWLESRLPRPALGVLMAGIIIVLTTCAWKQAGYWKDSETLWRRSLACTTDNYLAHLNLGTALLGKGQVGEAIAQYQDALEINPRYRDACFDLGVAFMKQGKLDDAMAQFEQTLQLNPEDEPAHVALGNTLAHEGKFDEAISQYQAALQLRPDNAVAHGALGILLAQTGRWSESASHLQEASELDPANPRYKNDLAWLLSTCPDASVRNGSKAVDAARQAVALTHGQDPVILHALAAALAEAGQFPEAIDTAQRAMQMAETQSNTRLVEELKSELALYQSGIPFHAQEMRRP